VGGGGRGRISPNFDLKNTKDYSWKKKGLNSPDFEKINKNPNRQTFMMSSSK
jgi:hypothetical protein